MTNQLSEAQASQLVHIFNHLLDEGQLPNLLLTIAYSEQMVLERLVETGRDKNMELLHKGFDDLIRLVTVPMGKA